MTTVTDYIMNRMLTQEMQALPKRSALQGALQARKLALHRNGANGRRRPAIDAGETLV